MDNRFHTKLWKMAFGVSDYPEVWVDKDMDEYSQKLPGIKHRLKDYDPLRVADYEDSQPELDKWRIIYRIYHISVDWWWTLLSKEEKCTWIERIRKGYYPPEIDKYFWKILEQIADAPLSIYELMPWKCNPLPFSWVEYIRSGQRNA